MLITCKSTWAEPVQVFARSVTCKLILKEPKMSEKKPQISK